MKKIQYLENDCHWEEIFMKIAEIVGTNSAGSYNRKLLKYMQKQYSSDECELSVCEIDSLPLFNVSLLSGDLPQAVKVLYHEVETADAVIISTPEYDHAITAALKSALEWLSCRKELFFQKPVMIVGTSLGNQGTSRAQDSLRQILNSPGLCADVLSGHEFLLGHCQEQFNEAGVLKDQDTAGFLDECFTAFVQRVRMHQNRNEENVA